MLTKSAVQPIKVIMGVLVILGIVFALSTSFAFAENASFTLMPATQEVNPGDTFEVTVDISTDVPSKGAQFALRFDPSLLEVEGIDEGSFYSDKGNTMAFVANEDHENGYIGVWAVLLLEKNSSSQGKGELATVRFKAKPNANGIAELVFRILEIDENEKVTTFCRISDPDAHEIAPLNLNGALVGIGTAIDPGVTPPSSIQKKGMDPEKSIQPVGLGNLTNNQPQGTQAPEPTHMGDNPPQTPSNVSLYPNPNFEPDTATASIDEVPSESDQTFDTDNTVDGGASVMGEDTNEDDGGTSVGLYAGIIAVIVAVFVVGILWFIRSKKPA